MRTPHNPSPNLILLACTLAFIIISLDITVVNVGLRTIGSDLHTDITGLQWVMNAYTLAFASLLLTTGSLGDRIGQKPVMIAGLMLFTLASVACGQSGSVGTLITARLLQGVAAALCVPSSLALINVTFSDRKARAKAIGLWAGTSSIALGAGPIVGGFLIEHFGWPSIFRINVPFGLIGIWLTFAYAPSPLKSHTRSLDIVGQCLAILSLAGLATGCIEAGQYGWRSPVVLGGLTLFIAAGIAFLVTEARIREPMLPLVMFKSASMNTTSIIGTLVNFGYYGIMFAISLYFQVAKGYAPFAAGLAFIPMTAVLSAVNFASGALNARFGSRRLIFFGVTLSAIGYFSLTGIEGTTPYLLIMMALITIGAGMALTVPAITVVLMDGVEPAQAGIASGVFNTARQIGGVMGVGVFGSLLAGEGNVMTLGVRHAFVLSGLGMMTALTIAVIGLNAKSLPQNHHF